MKWLKDEDIQAFLNRNNYDVRVSGNARWIDQKCAADVITIVSDCILQYSEHNINTDFTSMDIWHDEYTIVNIEAIFKKPNPDEEKARSEYDKFFQQPMEMLAYAGVLGKHKRGARNFYYIANREILEYLSIRERNALTFLQLYIAKVLSDSGLMPMFEIFFNDQNNNTYEHLKDSFTDFTILYTRINKRTECHRIFIKIINPLAYQRNKRGTERGHLSKFVITYDMLMYNRDNFRDVYAEKPKELTRRQHAEITENIPSRRYYTYMSQKAKRLVRVFNDTFRSGRSELFDERHDSDLATHIHHIFPENEFPEICAYYENLIALTPTQHINYAHPEGNTSRINTAYQQICLIAKAGTIEEAINNVDYEQIYEFNRFMWVLFIGLRNEVFLHIADRDFARTIKTINLLYS